MRDLQLSLCEIERMTFFEYRMQMKAVALKQLREEYLIHLQAWTNREINATRRESKKKITYVYQNMKQFFDYEKHIKEVLERDGGRREPSSLAQKVMDYRRRKERGEL